MKNKGFTLIELLAVIVILAIIALIATPVVLNIIEDSKESAAKDSASVMAKAAETYYVSNVTLQGKEVTTIDLTDETLQYKGEKPEKGYVEFDDKGNSYLKMYMDGYCIVSDYDNTVMSTKMDSEECTMKSLEPVGPFEDGEVVYFNPVKNIVCKETDYNATTNSVNGFRGTIDNGCLKWYAFLDSEEATEVNLLLDHNTSTEEILWSDAVTEIANAADAEINLYGWHANVRGTARLMSATDITEIVKAYGATVEGFGTLPAEWTVDRGGNYYLITGTWTEYYSGTGHKLGWLFDNTMYCDDFGCNVSQRGQLGYWTSEMNGIRDAWQIFRDGRLMSGSLEMPDAGARPVITIPKSAF